MHNEKITLERIKRLIERLKGYLHSGRTEVKVMCTLAEARLNPDAVHHSTMWEIAIGKVWAKAWGSAWFLVRGTIPEELVGQEVGLWFDCDGEACVWKHKTPWQGLTPKVDWYHNAAKYFVPIAKSAVAGDTFELLIEAAANDLFGKGKEEYTLRECALIAWHEDVYQLMLDTEILLDLAKALPTGSVRRARIIHGLNDVCNIYADGKGIAEAKTITESLLAQPANASALTAFSIGHAHLDLAWLWPIRETRRKGGRTFANALRLLEQYPDYIFGASQAQLYQWMKSDYPGLFAQVKDAVRSGRWDVQGASWVEFDTNIPSGESIIRQFMYGRRWFKEEFGIEPDYLWLPDCFGFSANLPQLLQGCGVRYFITQKLSWNESNTFPHHLFKWQGIDGSEVLAHQMPTNDYNFSNNPSAFIATEERFAEKGSADAFLNLYGIGDGGGGPTRNHIEYGLRQRNLEGVSRFRFSTAREWLDHFGQMDQDSLPTMYGELYLELHRGTYTTQAKMKRNNFISETLLHQSEAVSAAAGLLTGDPSYPTELRSIWQDTLLMQFHDILPGSSIGMVYEDAAQLNSQNHTLLNQYINTRCKAFVEHCNGEDIHTVFNPYGVWKTDWIGIWPPDTGIPYVLNAQLLNSYLDTKHWRLQLRMAPYSFAEIRFNNDYDPTDKLELMAHEPRISITSQDGTLTMENEYLKVALQPDGSISSVWDKNLNRELLCGISNLLQLWEDEPNNWGAWDINHFYRETTPILPVNANPDNPFSIDGGTVSQTLLISGSKVHQRVSLVPGQRYIRFHHDVDWQERHKMLRVAFQPDILCENATCGVQLGSVQRPVNARNAWEAARFEFPAQGFVDMSDAEHGCALICHEKYGYSLHGKRMELNLLRSPADVDPTADIGSQSHTYYFYCHATPFAQAQVHELTRSLNIGFIHMEGKLRSAELLNGSLFRMEDEHLVISNLKPAEDGKGVILRMYEPLGRACNDYLHSLFPIRKVTRCDMLENPLEDMGTSKAIHARPFEIITLRVE